MYPILLRTDGFKIYSYGLFIAAGFIVGLVLAIRTARQKQIPVHRVVDLFFYTLLSSILGSRILFVLINFDLFGNILPKFSASGREGSSFTEG